MKKEDRDHVLEVIESEGFDYAFFHFSHFEEIKDKKFHELRKQFLKARKELQKYLKVPDYL